MAFLDLDAPIGGWNKTQKPYIEAIKKLKKNKLFEELASEGRFKELISGLKEAVRALDFEYLNKIIDALNKVATHTRKRKEIMEIIMDNVRWYKIKNVKKELKIKW